MGKIYYGLEQNDKRIEDIRNVFSSLTSGQFYAITFWPKIKIEKNVKIYQNTLSRDYLCKKIVKGGW